MSEYIAPRSVKRLEDELAELEKSLQGETEEEEQGDQEEEQQEAEQTSSEEPTSKEEETFKKRYSDLRRHSQKLADDLKEAQVAIAELKKQKTSAGLPTAEEAEEWAKSNPKAAAIIRAIAANETATNTEELSAIKAELAHREQEARIRKAHPDFEAITGDDKFHDWAEAQPDSVQKLIFSPVAEDVIWAIGQYKKENAVPVDQRKEAAKAVASKSSSVEPKTETKGRFSESKVNKMSLQEYEKNESAIQEAIKTGTFVYDLSGAAR